MPGLISALFLSFTPGPEIASPCEYLPVFLIANRTGPTAPSRLDRVMWNSFSVTLIVLTSAPLCATTPASAAPARAAARAATRMSGRVSFMPAVTELARNRIGLPSRPPRDRSRSRDRLAPAGGPQACRPAALVALYRRPVARRCGSGRSPAEREGQARDRRRARRGDHERGRGAGDHRSVPRRARADRRGGSRRERVGEADGTRARARSRALSRAPRSCRHRRSRARELRADRHGGLVDHRPNARALPGAARRRPRERRCRPPVVPAADAARRRRPRQRPTVQGHLRRARGARVPGRRRGPRELRSLSRSCSSSRARTSGSRPTTSI